MKGFRQITREKMCDIINDFARRYPFGAMIFPEKSTKKSSCKSLASKLVTEPHRLTFQGTKIFLENNFTSIMNLYNAGYGYAALQIHIETKVYFRKNVFFWEDEWGYWRAMKLSKKPGWALYFSSGVTTPHKKPLKGCKPVPLKIY